MISVRLGSIQGFYPPQGVWALFYDWAGGRHTQEVGELGITLSFYFKRFNQSRCWGRGSADERHMARISPQNHMTG